MTIRFFDNQRATTSNITLGTNNTSDYKASILSTNRSDYWESAGTSSTETILIDLQTSAHPVTFFGVVGPHGLPFDLNPNATVKVQASNILDWTSPPIDENVTVTDQGIFHQVAATTNTYRYWRLYMVDTQTNFDVIRNGVSHHIRFSNIWLSDHQEITGTNVTRGFSKSLVDPTSVFVTPSGRVFANTRS